MSWTTINPVTGLEKDQHQHANADQLEKALSSLHNSFCSWSLLSIAERQMVLKKFLVNFEARTEQLAALITEEMGKPIKDSVAEIKKCTQTIKSYLEYNYSDLEVEVLATAYKESVITHNPVGVVYSVMPWNFPFFQAIRMIVPTLLAGNTVLLKHSEITPKVGDIFETLLNDVWSKPLLHHLLVTHEMTELIIGDDRVGGVSITGSTEAGHAISNAAGKFMKKFVLELGGSDPVIICADADLRIAAKNAAKARLLNTGQSCICAKRCLVDAKILKPFLDMLKAEFETFIFGDPADLKTDLGPLAHPKFKKALAIQIDEFKKNTGAQLVYSKAHGFPESSAYVNAEIYLLKENHSWLYDQEFFAPVFAVIPFQSEAEAVQIANSTQFGLGAAVWSSDIPRAKKLASQLMAGQIAINDIVRSDVSLPFGGVKKSGLGRELHRLGILEFTQSKVISHS